MSKRLLCISYRFPPETYPLAIRVKYFLNHLRGEGWDVDAITAASDATSQDGLTVHHVPSWTPERLFEIVRTLRLEKLLDLFVWPDPFVFWVLPAYLQGRRLLQRNEYDALAIFMMPYSQGVLGPLLKRRTGLPLVLNLNDSPTCSDMNPSHPSHIHYRLARKMEDWFVKSSDAVIYVSRRNMERVRDRQPLQHRDSFHLIRRGAKSPPPSQPPGPNGDTFRLVYTGGTSGWYKFLDDEQPSSLPKRLYHFWQQLGTHSTASLDYRTHGPIYVGRAIKRAIRQQPEWTNQIEIDVYGPRYSDSVVNTVLDKYDLHEIVNVHGRVPHQDALQHMAEADLLFMSLPDRIDGSPGGRISAKTYEYLMTDRPILAALPPGENREYLQNKPGVSLTQPNAIEEMTEVIAEYASAKFSGESISIDRSDLHSSLSSTTRSQEFEDVLTDVLDEPSQFEDPDRALTING